MPEPALELVARARQGDEQALSELIRIHEPRLVRMVEMRLDASLRRRMDPSDVVQDACVEVVRRFDEWRKQEEMPFFVWLRLVTGQSLALAKRRHLGAHMRDSLRDVGAVLSVFEGEDSTVADTVVLQAAFLPFASIGLFFQGTTTPVGTVFGDGHLCVGGTILRLAVKPADNNQMAFYPALNDPPLSVAGGVPIDGGLRSYQFWYRDAASFCTSATFNLTNGLAIRWAR